MANKIKPTTIDFLFEIGTLQNMRRMQSQLLPSDKESLASHSFRVAIIAYILCQDLNLDKNKVLKMALFHDIVETRLGDANYIHSQYVTRNYEKVFKDQLGSHSFGEEIIKLLKELEVGESKEAILVRDSDQLEQILSQKENLCNSPKDFLLWHNNIVKRIKTKKAKEFANKIKTRNPMQWVYNLAGINSDTV